MSRPPNIIRPKQLTFILPEDIRAKMDLYLWSELENRVPYGAYSKFIGGLLNEFFDKQKEQPSDPRTATENPRLEG